MRNLETTHAHKSTTETKNCHFKTAIVALTLEIYASIISLETLVRIAVFFDVSPVYSINGTATATEEYLQGELSEIV